MTRLHNDQAELGGDRYKLNSRRTFDRWGAAYDRNVFVRLFAGAWDQEILDELGGLPPRARVLDLGCATGRLLARLAARPGFELAGADLSGVSLASAGRKLGALGRSAELKQCDIEQPLPWDDASFDAVVSCGVLHHLPQPVRAFECALRVLRPGGTFIVADPLFPAPLRQLVNAVLRVRPVHGDCRFHHPAAVLCLLELPGFDHTRWRRISWHSFMAVATRPAQARMG